jgi:hypothetical protein
LEDAEFLAIECLNSSRIPDRRNRNRNGPNQIPRTRRKLRTSADKTSAGRSCGVD